MAGLDGIVPAEPDGPIRVAVVDDHELVRSGICNALGLATEIEVVGEAGDGVAALDLLEREAVDVLLLDLHMPRLDGFGCLDAVTRRWPDMPVIILTVDEDPEVGLDVMRRGAAAYAPKFIRPADLASLVRQVAGGAVLVGRPRLARTISLGKDFETSSSPSSLGLTERELEILALVAQGKTNADIAQQLFVTTKTVKFHVTNIFCKLGVHNRTEAALFAINHGLAPHDPGDGGTKPQNLAGLGPPVP